VYGIECSEEFVEWQVGVVLKAEMMYLPLLWSAQYCTFNLFRVWILADIPNLKWLIADMIQ
jgi:hypothetical protein